MSDTSILFLSAICWLMGFGSCWLYCKLKLEAQERQVHNLNSALNQAGDTILAQVDEIQRILEKASQCESGIIN